MWLRKTSWNNNFKLKHQFYPNPNYCTLRVTRQVTRDLILTLISPGKNTLLINNLTSIKGIKRVFPEPYEVKVEFISPFFEERDDEFVACKVRFIGGITVSGVEYEKGVFTQLNLKKL